MQYLSHDYIPYQNAQSCTPRVVVQREVVSLKLKDKHAYDASQTCWRSQVKRFILGPQAKYLHFADVDVG
jgi:hypothetical protein